jgi:hypothetical protein
MQNGKSNNELRRNKSEQKNQRQKSTGSIHDSRLTIDENKPTMKLLFIFITLIGICLSHRVPRVNAAPAKPVSSYQIVPTTLLVSF